jgi:hypothetical protein
MQFPFSIKFTVIDFLEFDSPLVSSFSLLENKLIFRLSLFLLILFFKKLNLAKEVCVLSIFYYLNYIQ